MLMVVAAVSFLVSMVVIGLAERGTNPDIANLFDVAWWWVVTSTTVGYGDIVPITVAGRIVAVFTIISGFFIFTTLIAIVVESTLELMERKVRGRAPVRVTDHLLICEYTAMADELIQSLPRIPELADYPVVIATDLVERNPYSQHTFVSGVPINPAVLRRANCPKAAMVFIFANFRFADPDVKTLHIALRVREQNPTAVIFVEVVDLAGDLMRHAPGDLVILSSRTAMAYLLRNEPLNPLDLVDDEQRTSVLAKLEARRSASH